MSAHGIVAGDAPALRVPARFLARRAQTLQHYTLYTGDPDGLAADLARYRAVTPSSVAAALARWLGEAIEVTTVPRSAAS